MKSVIVATRTFCQCTQMVIFTWCVIFCCLSQVVLVAVLSVSYLSPLRYQKDDLWAGLDVYSLRICRRDFISVSDEMTVACWHLFCRFI